MYSDACYISVRDHISVRLSNIVYSDACYISVRDHISVRLSNIVYSDACYISVHDHISVRMSVVIQSDPGRLLEKSFFRCECMPELGREYFYERN